MAATYPSGIKAFPTYANGDQVTPTTINDPDLEITAIETGLLDGFAHHLVPDATANQRSLGAVGLQWYDLFLSHDLHVSGGVTLTGTVTVDTLVVQTHGQFQGTIGVSGDATFAANVHVTGTTNLVGNVVLGTDLTVNGDATINGTVTISSLDMVQANVSDLLTVGGTIQGGIILAEKIDVTASLAGNYIGAFRNTSTTGKGVLIQAGLGSEISLDVQTQNSVSLLAVTANGTVLASGTIKASTLYAQANITANYNMIAQNASPTGFGLLVEAAAGTNFAVRVDNYLGTLVWGVLGNGTVSLTRDLATTGVGVAVGTGPTNLYRALRVNGADVGGLMMVCGTLVGNAAIGFVDWVLAMTDGHASLIAGHSKGAAAARTYGWNTATLDFQLTMGAGLYNVSVLPVMVGTPGA